MGLSVGFYRVQSWTRNKLIIGGILATLPHSAVYADMVDDLDLIDNNKPKVEEKTPEPPPKEKQPDKTSKPVEDPKGPSSGPKKGEKKAKPIKADIEDGQRKKLPIQIKSDGDATYSKNGGTVHLIKNVRISQGNLFFRSDEAKAFFIDVDGEKLVDKVEIFGNVRVAKHAVDPKKIVKASGNRAFFYNSQRKVILIGNARLWQGGHLIKGKQITYDVDTGIVKVNQAEGVVQPREATKAKEKKKTRKNP